MAMLKNDTRISQKDVARLAGVARSAVSMHLNNYPGVAKATQAKIQAAIEKLGYKPSRVAQSLKRGSSMMIGTIFFGNPSGTIHDFVLLDLLQGVQKAAWEENYVTSFFFHENDSIEETLSNILKNNLEGLIIIEDNFNPSCLRGIDLPRVVINRKVRNIPSVYYDAKKGLVLAMRHLVSLGHRNIAFIGGPLDQKTFRERFSGYAETLTAAGSPLRDTLVRHNVTDTKDAYLATRELLAGKTPFTAVACDNDIKASGAIDALKDHGLQIPQDISVTGFDNIPLCEKITPRLTTVKTPRKEIGFRGAKMLMEMIKGITNGADIEVPMSLIERESCAKPL